MKEIYIILKGRIGNQLFIYSYARTLQKKFGNDCKIIIDDVEVLSMNWENSLIHYDLPNVEYVHDRKRAKSKNWFIKFVILRIGEKICNCFNKAENIDYFQKKFKREAIIRPILKIFGVYLCENGFVDFKIRERRRILLSGYFQSERYFEQYRNELISYFAMKNNLDYPNLDLLSQSSSVCISVKVEHNVGSSMYAVCGKEYWKEAIDYIIKKIENPLFFVCSDNVEYVKENLIDCSKYQVIFQDSKQPVFKSLAAMARCKYFIIGNTTFAWWAQYMSEYPEKIVIAPNRWMLVDMPIDIYQSDWHLIDVEKHIGIHYEK